LIHSSRKATVSAPPVNLFSRVTSFFGLPGESFGDFCIRVEIAAGEVAGGIETA
jgi:hypothetical protein